MESSYRALTLLLGAGLLVAGCKRDADAPLARETLFPARPSQPSVAKAANRSVLERVALLTESGDNDTAATAMAIPDNAVVQGTLAAAAPAEAAAAKNGAASDTTGRSPKGKSRRPRRHLIDADWYRLAVPAESGQISRVELRDAPKCSRLEIWRPGEKTALLAARWERRKRPLLDALRRDEGQLFIRVACVGRSAPEDAQAAYRLAVTTRPRRLDEEGEPNDSVGPGTELIPMGPGVQATLAHRGDADVFRLDLSAAVPAEALVLGVTGVPDVSLSVQLLDEAGEKVLLERRPPRGQGVLLPNLDVRRTGTRPTLRVATVSGVGPDSPYSASLRPLAPEGCPSQAACPERVPVEREPNDSRQGAMGISHDSLITGIIDGSGDADWYAIDGEPGRIASVEVEPPEGLALTLSVSDGPTPWAETAATVAGQRQIFAGWRLVRRRFYVRVGAVGQGHDRGHSYLLRVRLTEPAHFEDEAATTPTGLPTPMAVSGSGGWQRQGALVPAGDVDRFTLDLRDRTVAVRGELRCAGDGAPGLRCRLLDAKGVEALVVQAPARADEVARLAMALAPGLWTVEVRADEPRMAPSSYRVELTDASALEAALALPEDLTASAPLRVPGPMEAPPGPPTPPR